MDKVAPMPGINIFSYPAGDNKGLEGRLTAGEARDRELFPHLERSCESPAPRVLACLREHGAQRLLKAQRAGWTCYLESEHAPAAGWETWLDKLSAQAEPRKLWSELAALLPGAFFLLAVNATTGEIAYANDALARLPVYICQLEGGLALGRDIGILLDAFAELTPEPKYLALNQIFGYVPGRGSFYSQIDTLSGASFGHWDPASRKLSQSASPELRFVVPRPGENRQERLREVAEAFSQACLGLYARRSPVLALSGGYDSRAILAALAAKGVKPVSATYSDAENTAGDDVRIAAKLAVALGLEHYHLILKQEGPELYEKLFRLKRGLNYLGVAFLVDFLEQLRQSVPGGTELVTGDGGDKLLPCLLPKLPLANARDFLALLYAQNAFFAPGEAARLYGVGLEELEQHILATVESYPSRDWNERYKQFLLAERGGRWLFEGEDRNRWFCASRTPFYDPEFYRLALEIPDSWKRDLLFYRQFLKLLHPDLARIRTEGSPVGPGHWGYGAWNILRGKLGGNALLRRLKGGLQGEVRLRTGGLLAERITALAGTDAAQKALSRPNELLTPEYLAGLNRNQLNQIYTNLAAVCGKI